MKKIYYIVGSKQVYTASGGGKPELFSAVGYNKHSMEKKKRELEKEYGKTYIFWVGDQWKDKNGMDEILKLPKHESMR